MTKQGFKQSWWLLAIALLVCGLGAWSLIQAPEHGEGIGVGGSVTVVVVGYILWAAGVSLWIDASKTHDKENGDMEQKEEQSNGNKD